MDVSQRALCANSLLFDVGAILGGFGAWHSGWRHFLSWKGRIGRRIFVGGFIALCLVSSALGMFWHGVLTLLGMTDFEIMGLVLIGAGLVPASALITQRTHDIGWSAFIPLGLALVLGAPFLTILDFYSGYFGHVLARVAHASGFDINGLVPFAMIGNGLWLVFAVFLMVREGQSGTNRFGPDPTPT